MSRRRLLLRAGLAVGLIVWAGCQARVKPVPTPEAPSAQAREPIARDLAHASDEAVRRPGLKLSHPQHCKMRREGKQGSIAKRWSSRTGNPVEGKTEFRFRRDRLQHGRHVGVWAPVIACKTKVANDNLALAA